jgi:N-acetyl-anhydromuramyl-L-alanine amidase AmpD
MRWQERVQRDAAGSGAQEVNVQYAYSPYFTSTLDSNPPGRLIVGIVLHDTESHASVNPRQEGSWHYEIDRNGAISQFVDEADIAWHVRACDRWWPDWLPHWGDYAVSHMNEWSIGIELVSDATYRAAGEPYTDAQYTALAALIRDLFARRGVLPIVGHGQVQADRSDPVAFDWDRFTNLLETTEDDMAKLTEDQRAILEKMTGLHANSSSIDSWLNEIGALGEENGKLRDEVRGLTDQLAQAPMQTERSIVSVAVNRKDGSVDVLN